jgi:SAM-dependent methyltransferase
MGRWSERIAERRGRRALERQLEYQEAKAAKKQDEVRKLGTANFLRSQTLRQRLSQHFPINSGTRVIEVGSGPHGLVFGFDADLGIGIDPLAVEYKRLFPSLQCRALTVAAIGEELPFADGAFDVVISDNVIDHATRPLAIVDELVRVLRPGGVMYFTVNVHHPVYELASKAHGLWNGIGFPLELSAFADHTVHLTEGRIGQYFEKFPLEILERNSTVGSTRSEQRRSPIRNADSVAKKVFFKNALFELIARKPS